VILETERTLLRRFTAGDLDTVAGWLADPVFTRHIGGVRSRAATAALLARFDAHWAEHGFGALAVEDRRTGELIGRSGTAFHPSWPSDPEVGWWIVPSWQGRGLATDAGAASIA
jgi:RimJ/RimL family protein N-acetyltransferase